MELDRRVAHLEPPDVDAHEEIIRKRRHLATVDDEVVDLVAAKAFDCVLEHLRVLDVAAVGHHLGLGLLEPLQALVGLLGQEAGHPAPILAAPVRRARLELVGRKQHRTVVAVVDRARRR